MFLLVYQKDCLPSEAFFNIKSPFFLVILSLSLFACQNQEAELPILGPKKLEKKKVNGQWLTNTVHHKIGPFSFINQDGQKVTERNFRGKVYVADFVFTTCPTICPLMSGQMRRLYDQFKSQENILFLSHSIDPERDSVPALKAYALRYGADGKQWQFVRGEMEEIKKMAFENYLVSMKNAPQAPGGILHSGAFILIDQRSRIRGIYDGTKKEAVDRLAKDIQKLLDEKKPDERNGKM